MASMNYNFWLLFARSFILFYLVLEVGIARLVNCVYVATNIMNVNIVG